MTPLAVAARPSVAVDLLVDVTTRTQPDCLRLDVVRRSSHPTSSVPYIPLTAASRASVTLTDGPRRPASSIISFQHNALPAFLVLRQGTRPPYVPCSVWRPTAGRLWGGMQSIPSVRLPDVATGRHTTITNRATSSCVVRACL